MRRGRLSFSFLYFKCKLRGRALHGVLPTPREFFFFGFWAYIPLICTRMFSVSRAKKFLWHANHIQILFSFKNCAWEEIENFFPSFQFMREWKFGSCLRKLSRPRSTNNGSSSMPTQRNPGTAWAASISMRASPHPRSNNTSGILSMCLVWYVTSERMMAAIFEVQLCRFFSCCARTITFSSSTTSKRRRWSYLSPFHTAL